MRVKVDGEEAVLHITDQSVMSEKELCDSWSLRGVLVWEKGQRTAQVDLCRCIPRCLKNPNNDRGSY